MTGVQIGAYVIQRFDVCQGRGIRGGAGAVQGGGMGKEALGDGCRGYSADSFEELGKGTRGRRERHGGGEARGARDDGGHAGGVVVVGGKGG